MLKTIPKGTLLFRFTDSVESDIRGYPKQDGTRCILSNHNVFFYPNPFTATLTLPEFFTSFSTVHAYVLTNDVKVIWLLKPSKYSRTIKAKKNSFMKRCSKTRKGCVDTVMKHGSHANYNPCLTDSIIEKYPDVVGFMAIAYNDMKRLKSNLKNTPQSIKKYLHFATDSNKNSSVPEISLHPLRSRPSKDLIVRQKDVLENNYKHLAEIKVSDESLKTFMDKHAVYNPETFFYEYKE